MESSSTAITSVILFLLCLVFTGMTLYEFEGLNRRKLFLIRTGRRYGHGVHNRDRIRFCLFLFAMVASGFSSFVTAFSSHVESDLSVERVDGTSSLALEGGANFDTEKDGEGVFFFTPVSVSPEETANEAESLFVRVSYMPNIPVLVSEFEDNKEF